MSIKTPQDEVNRALRHILNSYLGSISGASSLCARWPLHEHLFYVSGYRPHAAAFAETVWPVLSSAAHNSCQTRKTAKKKNIFEERLQIDEKL